VITNMHNLIAMDKEGKLKPAQILQVSSYRNTQPKDGSRGTRNGCKNGLDAGQG
jgi:hypothetical protein